MFQYYENKKMKFKFITKLKQNYTDENFEKVIKKIFSENLDLFIQEERINDFLLRLDLKKVGDYIKNLYKK